jgi:hypothetical protein
MSDTVKDVALEPEAEPEADQAVRKRAFQMWELEGSPPGREEEYWLRARERIEAETHSAYPPVQSGHHRT